MADTKTYQVSFYTSNIIDGTDSPPALNDALSVLSEDDLPFEVENPVDGLVYQLRELTQMTDSRYQGVIAKFRYSDLPNIGDRSTKDERPIDLDEQEGLIEKNFFLFDPSLNLITYQINGNGCNISRVAEVFDALVTGKLERLASVNMTPVLRPDAIERIVNGSMKARKFEIGFSRPTNVSAFSGTDSFSNEIMQLLSGLDGASMNLTISANLPGKSSARNFLSDVVKSGVAHFSQQAQVRVSKIWFDDASDPIDLIEDRIKGTTKAVPINGRYPNQVAIFSALNQVWLNYKDEILQVLSESGLE